MKRLWLLTAILLATCVSPQNPQLLKDFFDVNSITQVRMDNYQGEFILSDDQLVKFKEELGNSISTTQSLKLGSIGFMIFYQGDSSMIYSNSASSFIECPSEMFESMNETTRLNPGTRYFSTNAINYQNYSPTK